METKIIKFYKYEAAGNDFTAVDNRDKKISSLADLAKKICRRKFSAGADGLLVLENSECADIKMRIFNPDGSEVNMCGNGLRCISLFAYELGASQDSLSIETGAGIMKAVISGCNDDYVSAKVKTRFNLPKDLNLNFKLDLGEEETVLSFINTGVEHVVWILDDLKNTDVVKKGRIIRYHEKFKPAGTNVNFVKIKGRNLISVRTYERGVEDETLACGTGSVASALISGFNGLVDSPVSVETKSGQILEIDFLREKTTVKQVSIKGNVKKVYTGRYYNV